MKRIFAMMLILVLAMSFVTGCGTATTKTEYDVQVNAAIEFLEEEWKSTFEKREESGVTGIFEIKNTCMITFVDTFELNEDTELFENIDYIVEFLLYTDATGSAPYTVIEDRSNAVTVYKDGSMKIENNLYNCIMRYFKDGSFYKDIIDNVSDFGDTYNVKKNLLSNKTNKVHTTKTSDEYDEKVNSAFEAVKGYYNSWSEGAPSHLETKHTRIIEMNNEIDYIVEFGLYTDFQNTEPYYLLESYTHSVTVYKDGTIEIINSLENDFNISNWQKVSYNADDVIEEILDFGTAYNREVDL